MKYQIPTSIFFMEKMKYYTAHKLIQKWTRDIYFNIFWDEKASFT
jgi:hypothetical protein